MKSTPVLFSFFSFLLCMLVMPGVMALEDICTGFEDLSLDDKWEVGDSFESEGFTFTVSDFDSGYGFDPDSDAVFVRLSDEYIDLPGTVPTQALWFNYINIGMDLSTYSEFPKVVSFDYWISGSTMNLEINGELLIRHMWEDYDGLVAGGVLIRVFQNPDTGESCGRVELQGVVENFIVGGEQVLFDNLCLSWTEPPRDLTSCVDFNTVPEDFFASFEQEFSVQGVSFTANEFFWYPEGSNTEGFIEINHDAGRHGVTLRDSNLSYEFPAGVSPAECLSILCSWGFENASNDNVNLEINGTLLNKEDIMELDGEEVGDVTVSVIAIGEYTKLVQLLGSVYSFKIGGREMDIIEICPDCNDLFLTDCVTFEELPEYTSFDNGENILADGVLFSTSDFYWIDGQVFSEGTADVFDSSITQKPMLFLGNINVGYDFASYEPTPECVSIFYEASGGNKNLEVNGTLFNKDEMHEFDGLYAGDVLIRVTERSDDWGVIQLQGPVSSFKVGGQELGLLEICPFCKELPEEYFGEPFADCVDFTTAEEEFELGIWEEFFFDEILFTTDRFGEGAYWTHDGVLTLGDPWGYGVGLWFDNINISHDFTLASEPVECVSIYYIDFGGDKNLRINEDHRYVRGDNFEEVHGELVGEVMVSDYALEGDARVLVLQGSVSSFLVGGQELYVSKICPSCKDTPNVPDPAVPFTECVTFDTLPEGYYRSTKDGFAQIQGVVFSLSEFRYGPGPDEIWDDGAVALGEEDGNPILWVMHTNLGYDFSNEPSQPQCVSISCMYSATINLEVNGELFVGDVVDLDDFTVDDVVIRILGEEYGFATIQLQGTINSFKIGGEEFYLTELCPFCEDIPDDPEGEDDIEGEETSVEGEDEEVVFFTECVNFSTLPEGYSRSMEDGYAQIEGVVFSLSEFQSGPGPDDTVADGFVGLGDDEDGNPVLWVMHTNLGYDFSNEPPQPQCVSLSGGYYGGTINLEVNGELFVEFDDINALDGRTTVDGDVVIRIYEEENGLVTIQLQGTINSFKVGGEEFFLIDLCPFCEDIPDDPEGEEEPWPGDPLTECVDFSDLPESLTVGVDDYVYVQGVALRTSGFYDSEDAELYEEGLALSEFFEEGKSVLFLSLINVGYDFANSPAQPQCVSIACGFSGGSVNLEVNGELKVAESMADLDHAWFNGVSVRVYPTGYDTAILQLSGGIDSFKIGGQEFYLIEICPSCETYHLVDCVTFDDLPEGLEFENLSTFLSNGTLFETTTFTYYDGSVSREGTAEVIESDDGAQALQLNAISVTHHFNVATHRLGCVSIDYINAGGDVNLGVNNDYFEAQSMTDLNGQVTESGVAISVYEEDGRGTVVMSGSIESFSIGGAELIVLEICDYCKELPVEGEPDDFEGEVEGELDDFEGELDDFEGEVEGELDDFEGEVEGELDDFEGEVEGELDDFEGELDDFEGELDDFEGEEEEPWPGDPLQDCVDFADVPPNEAFGVDEYLYSQGVAFRTSVLRKPTGAPYEDGTAGLGLDEDGKEVLWLNSINLGHRFDNSPSAPDCVSITYGYFGGDFNLEVNGVLTAVPYVIELDGTWLGGVQIRVFFKGHGRGVIQLRGEVHSFSIGGEEFFVTEICPSCDPDEKGAHGADLDGDFEISEEEAEAYVQSWEEGPGDLALAIRAYYIWKISGGKYDFNPNAEPPECWIPR